MDQLANDDFREIQANMDATLDEIDTSAVSTALSEIDDSLAVYAAGPSATESYIATLHIDHALASLGLACIERSPDLRFT